MCIEYTVIFGRLNNLKRWWLAIMTERELSEKLCAFGCMLKEMAEFPETDRQALLEIANELHDLSNKNYSPGTSWNDIKKQVQQPSKKKRYYDRSTGKELPF